MVKNKSIYFGFLFSCFSLSFQTSSAQDFLANQLKEWLTGSFDSEEQSLKDTSYFNIKLEIVPIWQGRTDASWFYVEQALAKDPAKPYRQRIYRVSRAENNIFESAVFMLEDPLRFAGHPEMVSKLPLDSIHKKEGCSVFLSWSIEENAFNGATRERACPSELRGASYASSEVKLKENMLLSWDRGFNEEGKQVWGAEKGGYIFLKKRK